jgi:acetolactate synthase-1/2/3 large subunit
MASVSAELTGKIGAVLGGPRGCPPRFARAPVIFVSSPGEPAPSGAPLKERLVVTAETASHRVAHAIQLALAEPRGPVHLEVAPDVAAREALPRAFPVGPPAPAPADLAVLDAATEIVERARRPVVIAGAGCRPVDAKWLRAFAEAMPAPVLTTPRAKGAMPEPHPLAMGVFHGRDFDEPLLARADLVITFGVDPGETMPRGWRFAAPVLALARFPTSGVTPTGGSTLTPALEVLGDLAMVLEELAPRLGGKAAADWDVGWIERARRDRGGARAAVSGALTPGRAIQIARELTPVGTIATVDGGLALQAVLDAWLATDLGECLVPPGPSVTGFAVPAAAAARLTVVDQPAIAFAGAESLVAGAADLETVARLELPVTLVAFSAGSSAHMGPDLAALARALGWRASVARGEGELRRALVDGLAGPAPTLVAVRSLA